MMIDDFARMKNLAAGKTETEKMLLYNSHKKSPGIAAVLSFIVTGLGHIYCGKIGVGLMLLFLEIVLFFIGFLLFFPLFLAAFIWIISIIDAYDIAKKYNMLLYQAIFS